ncbi:MAG: METTL5 family protein [Nanoarchaeota archaeon]
MQNFQKPSWRLEQYPTDSEIAGEIIWFAEHYGDIKGKTLADLGCGTGTLGIGALFFYPEKVFFVDVDEKPLKLLKENLLLMDLNEGYEILCQNVKDFNQKVDVVLQNPPFGVKSEHADKAFLEKAFEIADVVYSFHKLSTQEFIEKFATANGFKITHFFKLDFPLKRTQEFHTKKIQRIEVGCWRFQKVL